MPVNPWENCASSELLYKSNRPQVSMGFRLINTVAHNCHGKRNNLTATSRQKKKTHGKRNNFTAKRKDSRQKEKDSRQKEKPHAKKKNLTAKRKRLTAKRKRLTAKVKVCPHVGLGRVIKVHHGIRKCSKGVSGCCFGWRQLLFKLWER